MALGPKHVVAVTTEEQKDCCIDGIGVKLSTYLYIVTPSVAKKNNVY
jgi:hypothetical protein